MKRKLPMSQVISSTKGMDAYEKRPATKDTKRRPCADEYNNMYRKPKDNVTDKRPEHA